jgi:hypothetical protein
MKIPNPFRFLAAILRSIRTWRKGKEVFVPAEVAADRQHVCEECDELDQKIRQCKNCGCMIDVKTQLSTEECPLKKWGVWEKPI